MTMINSKQVLLELVQELEQLQIAEHEILTQLRTGLSLSFRNSRQEAVDNSIEYQVDANRRRPRFEIGDTVLITSKVVLPKSEKEKNRTVVTFEDTIGEIVGWTASGRAKIETRRLWTTDRKTSNLKLVRRRRKQQ